MKLNEQNFREQVHHRIVKSFNEISVWFQEKSKGSIFPFYSSFDIRDSSLKVAPVDANVFPAGFNHICDEDQDHSSHLIKDYLSKHYPTVKKILLLAEEHTHNLYYWDNIYRIKTLIEKAGFEVSVCIPGKILSAQSKWETASGYTLSLHILEKEKGDLILSNNDFSSDYDLPLDRPLTPCLEMGWHKRKKHDFFNHYNQIAKEFAELIKMDPWHFTIQTHLFSPFDIKSEENKKKLKQEVKNILENLEREQSPVFKGKPYLFLKNNSGTYGLGVVSLEHYEEVDQWNYKVRKAFKASKGGKGVKELILQEGILTSLSQDGYAAEPTVYMIGSRLAGGFLRTHKDKNVKENLNSPGALFKRLCIRNLEVEIEGYVMENVYGWVARLGFLALLQEIKENNLDFRGYQV